MNAFNNIISVFTIEEGAVFKAIKFQNSFTTLFVMWELTFVEKFLKLKEQTISDSDQDGKFLIKRIR